MKTPEGDFIDSYLDTAHRLFEEDLRMEYELVDYDPKRYAEILTAHYGESASYYKLVSYADREVIDDMRMSQETQVLACQSFVRGAVIALSAIDKARTNLKIEGFRDERVAAMCARLTEDKRYMDADEQAELLGDCEAACEAYETLLNEFAFDSSYSDEMTDTLFYGFGFTMIAAEEALAAHREVEDRNANPYLSKDGSKELPKRASRRWDKVVANILERANTQE